MRPALKPGLLPVWRNRDTVQIGIDPRRAVALTGMRGADVLLRLLDGSRDRAQVLAAASDLGMDAVAADQVLSLLTAAGALSDLPAGGGGTLSAGARARLAPELATAALARGDADGGARTLARRQAACVRVHGASRPGLWIAGMLTAAGIGVVISTGPTAAGAGPGGAGPRGRARPASGGEGESRGPARAGPASRAPAAEPCRPGRQPPPGASGRAGRETGAAPGGLRERGHRRGGPACPARPVGLPALPRPDPGRTRPRLAAHPRPAISAARRRSPGV